ncbi:hypothetical protein WDU94_010814 [Cyamophila willieti]
MDVINDEYVFPTCNLSRKAYFLRVYYREVKQTREELKTSKRKYEPFNLNDYAQDDRIIELRYGNMETTGKIYNMFKNTDERIWMSIALTASDENDAKMKSQKVSSDFVLELQIYAKMWHRLGDQADGRARIVQVFGDLVSFTDVKNFMKKGTLNTHENNYSTIEKNSKP